MAYPYRALPKGYIRLIRFDTRQGDANIRLSMLDSVAIETRRYQAVSYQWGSDALTSSIRLDGQLRSVTANLYSLLQDIQQHHDTSTLYWVDGLCIQQEPERNEDKTTQMQQMWRVYSQATQVFAWFGSQHQVDFDYVAVFESHMILVRQEEEYRLSKDHSLSQWWKHKRRQRSDRQIRDLACDLLHQLTYFSRTWIVTEVLQARKLLFVIGPRSWDYDELMKGGLINVPGPLAMRDAVAYLRSDWANYNTKEERALMTLYNCFVAYAGTKSRKPEDKIWAMLGHPLCRQLVSNEMLEADSELLPGEVLLVTLEWLDRLKNVLPSGWFENALPPESRLRESTIWNALRHGLGLTYVNHDNFGVWVREHPAWDCTNLPTSITITRLGKTIPCDGPVLRTLLSGKPRPGKLSRAGRRTGPILTGVDKRTGMILVQHQIEDSGLAAFQKKWNKFTRMFRFDR